MRYWIMIAQPGSPSLDQLEHAGSTPWTGVRDPAARDLMTQRMALSDRILYLQPGPTEPAITGLMRVSAPGRPDPSQFDASHPAHDPAATRERPRWYCVPVELLARAPAPLRLEAMRAEPGLAGLPLLSGGPLPVIAPLEPGHFRLLVKLAGMRQRKQGPGAGSG